MIKYKIDILKKGTKNNDLCTIIAAHNGGEVPTSIPDIISFASAEKARFPTLSSGFQIWREDERDNLLYVSEDGGASCTLTIEEIELNELEEIDLP